MQGAVDADPERPQQIYERGVDLISEPWKCKHSRDRGNIRVIQDD